MGNEKTTTREERLFHAAKTGDLQTAQQAVEDGASVNTCSDWDGSTPLSCAALGKHIGIVEYLLANGADASGGKSTSIDIGNPEELKERISGALSEIFQVVADNVEKNNTSQAATAAQAAPEAIAPLTSFDDPPVGDGEFGDDDDDDESEDDAHDSPLAAAAMVGSIEIMELLKSKGAKLKRPDSFKMLPLAAAARAGHLEACEWLLQNGASVRGNHVSTPLHAAAEGGNAEIVSLLLGKGADPNYGEPEDGYTALHEVTTVAAAKVLLDAGADANVCVDGETPIVSAGSQGNAELVELLAKHTSDAEVVAEAREELTQQLRSGSRETQSLVDSACFSDIERFTEKLGAPGADVNGFDSEGEMTALLMAARHSRPRIVHALLQAGADPSVANGRNGDSVLHELASSAESADLGKLLSIAKALCDAGAPLNATNASGAPVLHQTLHCPPLLQLLLEMGADGHVANAEGQTALDVAQERLASYSEPPSPDFDMQAEEEEEEEEEAPKGLFGRIGNLFRPKKATKPAGAAALQGFMASMMESIGQMGAVQQEQLQKSEEMLRLHLESQGNKS